MQTKRTQPGRVPGNAINNFSHSLSLSFSRRCTHVLCMHDQIFGYLSPRIVSRLVNSSSPKLPTSKSQDPENKKQKIKKLKQIPGFNHLLQNQNKKMR